jgi:hypothetical protein
LPFTLTEHGVSVAVSVNVAVTVPVMVIVEVFVTVGVPVAVMVVVGVFVTVMVVVETFVSVGVAVTVSVIIGANAGEAEAGLLFFLQPVKQITSKYTESADNNKILFISITSLLYFRLHFQLFYKIIF